MSFPFLFLFFGEGGGGHEVVMDCDGRNEGAANNTPGCYQR